MILSAIGKTRPRKSVRKCFRAYMGIHSGARVKLAGKSQPPLNFFPKRRFANHAA
jgi:hypothetical protein